MTYKIVSRTLVDDGGDHVIYQRVEVANAIESANPTCIPFDSHNRHCQQFVIDWRAGADVVDNAGDPVAYSDELLTAMGLASLIA